MEISSADGLVTEVPLSSLLLLLKLVLPLFRESLSLSLILISGIEGRGGGSSIFEARGDTGTGSPSKDSVEVVESAKVECLDE